MYVCIITSSKYVCVHNNRVKNKYMIYDKYLTKDTHAHSTCIN